MAKDATVVEDAAAVVEDQAEPVEAPAPVVDQVALVSYNADGTPAQSPGFVVLPDPTDA